MAGPDKHQALIAASLPLPEPRWRGLAANLGEGAVGEV